MHACFISTLHVNDQVVTNISMMMHSPRGEKPNLLRFQLLFSIVVASREISFLLAGKCYQLVAGRDDPRVNRLTRTHTLACTASQKHGRL